MNSETLPTNPKTGELLPFTFLLFATVVFSIMISSCISFPVNTQAAVKNPTLSGLRKHEEGVPGDHYVKSQLITALLSAVIRYIDPSREFNSAYIPSIQYGDVNLCCKLRALGSGAEPNAVRCGARNTELRSKEDKREIK
ncbi:hypothetical protein BGY98DRAFT_1181359 [Russula aff. rugulosa BPL654]|nr:hypothetical protein BGY98DRAFT_1181359 [Russula aff. rugulosa BPL654]